MSHADPVQVISPNAVIGIVGVGLIGGSIAAAVQKRYSDWRVIGFGRDTDRMNGAVELGLLDEARILVPKKPESIVKDIDFAIVCTPVQTIAHHARLIAAHCKESAVITDAGSVKQSICDALPNGLADGIHFLGSHPLAGSEKQGYEHADADLYEDRVCVLTPTEFTVPQSIAKVAAFWSGLGMRVLPMTPETHDSALALTSHLPHLLAGALAGLLTTEELDHLTASGFRDTTRVAAGDAQLWTEIFSSNRDAVLESISQFRERLDQFQSALEGKNESDLHRLLAEGKLARDRLDTKENS
ncbi:prephenate dehydrogenase [Calycomorphotria hydatis]|uniref:Prephenate dehydrogenase n=1 Tax=Calycomorphotria hydatis TaxID=2528027 RepID=A0A517TAJ3_9PLAN|nr:prephenate dehydrogenase/arogenate dehydrogenase family protein [Calycomorphotria hydatis]QDT65387.1 prephenate dehydrogenase [Calycomorphotria hydatis]